jgi:hypothetical protein
MGDVIRFPRRPGEDEPVVVPAPAPVEKPDPVGVSKAIGARVGRRLRFELAHVPRRLWRLLRYFFRGVIGHRDSNGAWVGGWLGLISWCLALREREDARHLAEDKPGKQLAATQRADHLAVWHSGVVVVPQLAAVWAAEMYLGAWWLALVPLIVATAVYGWRTDPRPPGPLDPHQPGDVTRDALDAALRAVGILDKPTANRPAPDGVRLIRLPRIVGGGQELVFDLPASVKASAMDVIRERARLAASLAVPLPQLVLEPGEHPGRVVLWHAKRDPFSTAPTEHPLLDADRWSVFDPIPFGTDARGRRVAAPVVGTHWLVGAVPNAGKTSSARGLTAGPVLDPHTDLYVFDGKMGKDWAALDGIAAQYESGPIPEQAEKLHALLVRLIEEGDRRFQRMKALPDEVCPDSSITRGLAAAGMPFVWLVVDEAHRHLGDERYGQQITNLLIQYVKGYRACGFGLLVCTQDAEGGVAERFTALRRVTGTRLALRVMDWQASNMILGDQMNTRGWNAADILPEQKGTGILRGDLEADSSGQVARMLRTYYLDNAAWRAICETGRALRRARGGPEPDPAGQEPEGDEFLSATELLERIRRFAPEVLPAAVDHPQAVGEWLASRGVRTEPQKIGKYRVRSRVAVEVALGLARGCLQGDAGVTQESGASPESHPARQLGVTVAAGSESPPEGA